MICYLGGDDVFYFAIASAYRRTRRFVVTRCCVSYFLNDHEDAKDRFLHQFLGTERTEKGGDRI